MIMKRDVKKIVMSQMILIVMVLGLFIGAVAFIKNPEDYSLERMESRFQRSGGASMYGYTFVDWETLLQSSAKDEYINYVVQGLDFAFVQAQWSVVCNVDNDTLNEDYLGNLTLYIKELADEGVQVVIHTWVSSYSPNWIKPLVPELYGQGDRWQGIDPNTENETALEHRQILKDSMVHYHDILADYFINEGVGDSIRGFCLDDETQSEHWVDYFEEVTDVLLSYNASWRIGSMFNRHDKYHMTGETGMTCNYLDPYDHDQKFVQKIDYAFDVSGVNNISVLIDAMGSHDNTAFHNKMRRQAWIAWFMGVDSIGWYTYLYGTDDWAALKWNSGNGPIITDKTYAALNATIDVHNLNDAYAKISTESDESIKSQMLNRLFNAYDEVKKNNFDQAREIVVEVINQ